MASARAQRLRAPALTLGGLAAATLALRLRDPHSSGSWGLCPLSALTGVQCPGCGGLRAVNDLTRGDVGAALSSNLLVTLAIPVAVLALAAWTLSSWRATSIGRMPTRWRTAAGAALAVVIVAFTLARNLPFGSWLAP